MKLKAREEQIVRIVLTNIKVDDKALLEEKLADSGLSKAIIVRQIFKKFVERTEDAIDFLFK